MSNNKGKKTTAVAATKVVLGLIVFAAWIKGLVGGVEAVGGIVLINYIGGIIADYLSKDKDASHSLTGTVDPDKKYPNGKG